MSDEEYSGYGGRRSNRRNDDEEEESRPSYGDSEVSARYNSPSYEKGGDRGVDEPNPEVPTEGYSLESTYGKNDEETGRRKPAYGESTDNETGYGRTHSSSYKPSRPSGISTSDEPDPVVPTAGYSLESTYGSSKLDTDAEGEEPSRYGRKPSKTSGYSRPQSGGTMDDAEPVEPTQGYSIDSVYGSGTKNNEDDTDGIGYGGRKISEAEDQESSGYGRPGKTGAYNKPSKITGAGTLDEPEPVEATQGYSIDSVYGSDKKKNDDDTEVTGYGDSTYGRGRRKEEKDSEESEKTTGYGRPGAYKPSNVTSDESDPVVPTEGYSIDSVYGSGRKKDEDTEVTGYGSRHKKNESGDDTENETKYVYRPSGRQESDDSDDEEKSSHKKHGHRRGQDDEEEEGKKSNYGEDDSEEGGRSTYGRTKYGSNYDEELASSTGGLSLDSDSYSENRRRGDDDDDDKRHRKHDDDEE